MIFDASALMVIALTFLLAGGVKGVIGLGLPSVSLGLLTASLDLTTAMALLVIPSLATNLWQAYAGQHTRALLLRLWPFLFAAFFSVFIGSLALKNVDLQLLTTLLGGLLISYSLLGLSGYKLTLSSAGGSYYAPVFGAINGVLTGLTGSFAIPGIMYLQAIGLSRDELVQAMGMLFSVSSIALAIALSGYEILTTQTAAISALAVVPAIAGMHIGQYFRLKLSPENFRLYFFYGLLFIGLYIIYRAAHFA